MSDMLKDPTMLMTPGEKAAYNDIQRGPHAGAVRRVLGGIVRGIGMFGGPGWESLIPAGDAISGVGKWRHNIQNELEQGQMERDAVTRAAQMQNMDLQRQEAQQRIAESRQRAANAELNARRTSYDRQMGNIEKVGGFEAPTIPPTIERQEMPMSPLLTQIPNSQAADDSDAVRNLPTRNLILSPGLRPEQSASLGTVQSLTDPDSEITRNMVYPSKAVQQEMQQGGWPKTTEEMADKLSDIGVQADTPVPQPVYNQYLRLMQTRQTQEQKTTPTPRPVSVAPGHSLVDTEGNVLYRAPGKPQSDQKPPTRGQFAAIESRKQSALAKAETDARKRLRGSSTVEPEDPDAVYADLAAQKQQIQNSYEQEISALTGNDVQHFEYPAAGTATAPSPSPRQPAAQPGGRTVSEAELRRQAAAAGKDPDAAVQIARKHGYKLLQ